jgi:hypothetical protein
MADKMVELNIERTGVEGEVDRLGDAMARNKRVTVTRKAEK